MDLVVGRVARAHGVTGEVAVEVRTDDPDHRYAIGNALMTDPPERGPLVVDRVRWHSGRLLVRFRDVADRDAAEALRGTLLVADSTSSRPSEDGEDFWDHDLIGLLAVLGDGTVVGEVRDIVHPPGSAVLVIGREGRDDALVPFVRALVPVVDLSQRRLVIQPPDGLLDL